MIDNNNLRVNSSNQYLMSSASGRNSACLTAPEHGELLIDSGLNSLAWLEQPMSLAEMQRNGNSSFVL
ncbi:hypothetical protein DYH09_23255 [bacterium CPR1]|nr:hypothetical protein [bacterium CPR1]